jgi:hypothetical protein
MPAALVVGLTAYRVTRVSSRTSVTCWMVSLMRSRSFVASSLGSILGKPCPTHTRLNQVERWFGIITQRAIRRGSFRSVRDRVTRINQFVEHYNRNCRPFAWTATADSIFQELARPCSPISGTSQKDGSNDDA